jgi:hypothetical protein
MTPDQVVVQFQQILSTMQRMVAASADVAERVDQLEAGSGELLGKLTELQGSLVLLLEHYQKHASAMEMLETRVALLEGRRVN